MFPSPQQRQCTGDLKRGPIEREVRRYLKAHPEFGGLVVNCIGLRAEESPGRAKAQVFKKNEGNSIAGCEWFDWLPIHEFTLSQVWRTIADAGQKPHPIYALGMTRFSCRFCVMASRQDLRTAALIDPDTFRAYVRLEERIGRTMMVPVAGIAMGLEAYTGVRLDRSVPDDRPARLLNHQEALL
jgi:3'-phosphoadenosine 5'-phosphosulfate sulfotransferase (PAPS reductase)/FAD synthetase